MNPVFLLDPPPVQSVSQRQSQIKGTRVWKVSCCQHHLHNCHWNNYYSGSFYRIYSHSISMRQLRQVLH